MSRITFQRETVKEMQAHLGLAYQAGDLRLIRRLVVLLAIAHGAGLKELLGVWKLSRQTAYTWLKAFVEKRWESLHYSKPSGRPPRLSKHQKQQLVEAVQAGPEAAGYSRGCWTTLLIQEWIFQQFGVTYNRFYVAELLRNLGFSYQKARFVSAHLDEERRKQWLEKVWPEILSLAQREKWLIFFEDEVSFAQWGSLSYTWALKGCQPVVKTSGIRKGYKIFGVIEFFSGTFYYQECDHRFNDLTYRAFLAALLAQVPGQILLIQDGAKYHTSREMQAFFEAHPNRLIVYQLPSYSPDYNPIEQVWRKVKKLATHNRYFAEFTQLIQAVEGALAKLDAHPEEILHLMGLYTKSTAEAPSA